MQGKRTVLIISSPVIWEIMCALDPHFKELSYKENLGSYLVLNLDEETRWAIVTPATFPDYFDRIEPGELIRTHHFFKK